MILWARALLLRLLGVVRLGMAQQEPLYECWNASCPRYVGNGHYLVQGEPDTWWAEDRLVRCKYCQSYVMHRSGTSATSKAIAGGGGGAAAGAAVGGAIAGPLGALIGMVVGAAVITAILSEKTKRPRPPHPRHRRT